MMPLGAYLKGDTTNCGITFTIVIARNISNVVSTKCRKANC